MKQEHMDPHDAVQFMDAVQAKKAFPIHWGTFPLTTEPILEPRQKLVEAMELAGKDQKTFSASFLGETIMSE
jgi:N-acyl-phosphatidylethanolamine-hydrolysing phospholipase D